MKRIISILLIGILILLTGCGMKEEKQRTDQTCSLYSWNRELFDNPAEVMGQLSEFNVNRIYQGFSPADFEKEETAAMLSKFNDMGVETTALFGDPNWDNAEDVIDWTLKPLIDYNNGVGSRAQIGSVNYDFEFYTEGRDDAEHFAAYVDLMEKVSTETHKADLKVIYCIPYWLPTLSEDLFKELLTQVDEISVMNYSIGQESTNLESIMKLARDAGVKVESIFETQLADGAGITENNTYYSKGKDAVVNAAKELQNQYHGLGIAYHHLTSLLSWN